jgi:hypothetical protein
MVSYTAHVHKIKIKRGERGETSVQGFTDVMMHHGDFFHVYTVQDRTGSFLWLKIFALYVHTGLLPYGIGIDDSTLRILDI